MKNRRSVHWIWPNSLRRKLTFIDLQSRAPAKGVISGVSLDIDDVWAYLIQKIPGAVSAHCLTRVVKGEKLIDIIVV
jgi:hypothetical protein